MVQSSWQAPTLSIASGLVITESSTKFAMRRCSSLYYGWDIGVRFTGDRPVVASTFLHRAAGDAELVVQFQLAPELGAAHFAPQQAAIFGDDARRFFGAF